MSEDKQESNPCPVCKTELVHTPKEDGVCPHCGESLLHRQNDIIRHPEHSKGVREKEVVVSITISEYVDGERSVDGDWLVERVSELLENDFRSIPFAEDEYEVSVDADA